MNTKRILAIILLVTIFAGIFTGCGAKDSKKLSSMVLVKVHTDLKTETARVILANSITLTPGTITVSLTEQELLVHCLDKTLAEGMEDSSFVKLLKKLEERAA